MAQNALAVRQDDSIQVTSLGELRALAADAAASRLFGAASPEQALMIMMAGKDLGLSYAQSLRSFHVIEGRPSLTADAMVAVCKSSPDCERFERVSESPEHATWAAKRRGESEQTSTFTLADAHRAGLIRKGGNWEKYPQRMLSARAKAFLARDVFPDLLAGLYDPDEIPVRAETAPRRVESDVRHVPESRPTPAPESGERTTHDADAAGLAEEMRAAMSVSELSQIGSRVGGFGFPADVRAALLATYQTHKARCTPPSDAGDSWEPARG